VYVGVIFVSGEEEGDGNGHSYGVSDGCVGSVIKIEDVWLICV
jgi:hypothetical protein